MTAGRPAARSGQAGSAARRLYCPANRRITNQVFIAHRIHLRGPHFSVRVLNSAPGRNPFSGCAWNDRRAGSGVFASGKRLAGSNGFIRVISQSILSAAPLFPPFSLVQHVLSADRASRSDDAADGQTTPRSDSFRIWERGEVATTDRDNRRRLMPLLERIGQQAFCY
jgi:hypothetical protein